MRFVPSAGMWPALERSSDPAYVHQPAALRRALESDGGFTLRLRSGEPVSDGICVATHPGRALSFPRADWSDRRVDEWISAVATEPSWRARCIGGWIDRSSDTVWLDVVHVMPRPCRRLAMAMARWSNQHCVFDLARHEAVPV